MTALSGQGAEKELQYKVKSEPRGGTGTGHSVLCWVHLVYSTLHNAAGHVLATVGCSFWLLQRARRPSLLLHWFPGGNGICEDSTLLLAVTAGPQASDLTFPLALPLLHPAWHLLFPDSLEELSSTSLWFLSWAPGFYTALVFPTVSQRVLYPTP